MLVEVWFHVIFDQQKWKNEWSVFRFSAAHKAAKPVSKLEQEKRKSGDILNVFLHVNNT